MINYTYRPLSGNYKGGSATSIYTDYGKINSCLYELSKDLPALDSRISNLEDNEATVFVTSDFATNSISGSVILAGTITGSKIAANSITGDKLVTASVSGIMDSNISSNANINPAKINISAIQHGSLANIGMLTHPQLEASLTSISTIANTATSTANNALTSVAGLYPFLGTQSLNTTAKDVTGAVNELLSDINSISFVVPSGVSIVGGYAAGHVLTATGSEYTIQETAVMASDTGISLQAQSVDPSLPPSGYMTLYPKGSGLYAEDWNGRVYPLTTTNNYAPLNIIYQLGTPASGVHGYAQLNGNSITLTPGTWEVNGHVLFGYDGAVSPEYNALSYEWRGANGTNSPGDMPDAFSGTVLYGVMIPRNTGGPSGYNECIWDGAGQSLASYFMVTSPIIVSVSMATPLYLDARVSCSVPVSNQVVTMIMAKQIN
jgi:hypothetical protein